MRPLSPTDVARRIARDIPDGSYVNLGIGLPTLVADVVGPDKEIVYHSENGILGMGPAPSPGEEDPELINAGKELVTLLPGGAYFHHTDSFMIMRGGHLDVSVLGAFQVFTEIFIMTNGGPLGRTTTIVYHIYQTAFKFFDMGYASAMAFGMFAMMFAFTLVQLRVMRGEVEY